MWLQALAARACIAQKTATTGLSTLVPLASVSDVVQGSCADACKGAGYGEPLQSGVMTTTSGRLPFYYCSVNANGKGFRPGFNVMGAGGFRGGPLHSSH
jgi:hypothetical protein